MPLSLRRVYLQVSFIVFAVFTASSVMAGQMGTGGGGRRRGFGRKYMGSNDDTVADNMSTSLDTVFLLTGQTNYLYIYI